MKLLIALIILTIVGCAHYTSTECLDGTIVHIKSLNSPNPALNKMVFYSRKRWGCKNSGY